MKNYDCPSMCIKGFSTSMAKKSFENG